MTLTRSCCKWRARKGGQCTRPSRPTTCCRGACEGPATGGRTARGARHVGLRTKSTRTLPQNHRRCCCCSLPAMQPPARAGTRRVTLRRASWGLLCSRWCWSQATCCTCPGVRLAACLLLLLLFGCRLLLDARADAGPLLCSAHAQALCTRQRRCLAHTACTSPSQPTSSAAG